MDGDSSSQVDLNQLSNLVLFHDLSAEEIRKVVDVSVIEKFTTNKTIVEEGDKNTEVYLVLDGEMIVSKWDAEHCSQVVIAKLPKEEMFGEMSFMDGSPRSTTVKTSKPATLLKISKSSLSPYPNILTKLISNMAAVNIGRLRSSNNQLVKTIRENQHLTQFIQTVGKLLFYQYLIFGIISLISLYFFKENALYISWLIALPVIIVVARNNRYEWTHFGVNLHHWPSVILLSLVSTGLVLGIVFYLSKMTLLVDLFEGWNFMNHLASPRYWGFFAFYSLAQEFIARGIFQTSLENFLNDDRGYKSIFINAAFLFVLLFPLGIVKATSIFLISLPLGMIYHKQKTLLGVFLIHFLLLGLGILKY